MRNCNETTREKSKSDRHAREIESMCLMTHEQLSELVERARTFQFGDMKVEFRGEDRWAVTWLGCCLAKPSRRFPLGRWVSELQPSDRSDAFKAKTRFPLKKAVELAKNLEADPYRASVPYRGK